MARPMHEFVWPGSRLSKSPVAELKLEMWAIKRGRDGGPGRGTLALEFQLRGTAEQATRPHCL